MIEILMEKGKEMENTLFQTRQLSVYNSIHYPDIRILKDQVNFIVGSSGTGKSTLLRLFNGILSPDSGDIFYMGKNLSGMDTIALRREVSLVSQSVYLFDTSLQENFRQFYAYREAKVPSEEVMKKYLDLCRIFFPLDKDCTSMSGGERQRVYIAIFLSFLPKVIMLDEPTSALDKENSHFVMQNILSFCKSEKISVIVVSHDNSITEKFADNMITIERRVT